MMPDLDGIEVCRRLKALPYLQSVPIIMVTALADKADLERCMSTGADDFIAKPVHRIELLARVSSRLRVKQHHDSLQIANQRLEAKGHAIAHHGDRMRNAINDVLGATQLLTATALTPEQDEHVRTARINGEILLTIANDFAAIARSNGDTLTLAQNSALLEPQRGRGA
jgi:two-component system, sensor histidine kinase and response regulator